MTGAIDTSMWPEVLQHAAEACGTGPALQLAAAYGGREIYVPRPEGIDEGHHLALTLGLATARSLAAALGAGRLIVPMGPTSTTAKRREAMRRMRREGVPIRRQAEVLGLHQRTVEIRHQRDREAGQADDPNGQTDLFKD